MLKNNPNYKLFNLTVIMFLMFLIFNNINIIRRILSICFLYISPFFLALFFSYLISPIVDNLKRKGLSIRLSVFLVVSFLILIIISFFSVILPIIYKEGSTIVIASIKNINLLTKHLNIDFSDVVNNRAASLLNIITTIGSGGVSIFSKVSNYTIKIILFIISLVYLLLDFEKIKKLSKRVSLYISDKFYLYLVSTDSILKKYFRSQLVIMLIQLIEYSILFLIIGHPNWILLGILSGILSFIPYIGGFLVNFISILTAVTISKRLLIKTVVVIIVFPLIDEYVINPKINGKTNDIDPLVSIIFISLLGYILGFIGIIIAIPLYLVIKNTFLYYKEDIKLILKNKKHSV